MTHCTRARRDRGTDTGFPPRVSDKRRARSLTRPRAEFSLIIRRRNNTCSISLIASDDVRSCVCVCTYVCTRRKKLFIPLVYRIVARIFRLARVYSARAHFRKFPFASLGVGGASEFRFDRSMSSELFVCFVFILAAQRRDGMLDDVGSSADYRRCLRPRPTTTCASSFGCWNAIGFSRPSRVVVRRIDQGFSHLRIPTCRARARARTHGVCKCERTSAVYIPARPRIRYGTS